MGMGINGRQRYKENRECRENGERKEIGTLGETWGIKGKLGKQEICGKEGKQGISGNYGKKGTQRILGNSENREFRKFGNRGY